MSLFIFVGTNKKEIGNFSDTSLLKIGKTYAGELRDNIIYLEGINGKFNPDCFLKRFTYTEYLVGTEIPTVGNYSYIGESPVDGGGMLKIKLSTITQVNKIDSDLYLVQTEHSNHIIYFVKVVS